MIIIRITRMFCSTEGYDVAVVASRLMNHDHPSERQNAIAAQLESEKPNAIPINGWTQPSIHFHLRSFRFPVPTQRYLDELQRERTNCFPRASQVQSRLTRRGPSPWAETESIPPARTYALNMRADWGSLGEYSERNIACAASDIFRAWPRLAKLQDSGLLSAPILNS